MNCFYEEEKLFIIIMVYKFLLLLIYNYSCRLLIEVTECAKFQNSYILFFEIATQPSDMLIVNAFVFTAI